MTFFFSNLGSCCRPTVLRQAAESNTSTTQMTVGGADDAGVHGPYNPKANKKPTSKSSAAHWRPRLSVISEDAVFKSDERKAQSEKRLSSKSRSAAMTRRFRRNDEYEYDSRYFFSVQDCYVRI